MQRIALILLTSTLATSTLADTGFALELLAGTADHTLTSKISGEIFDEDFSTEDSLTSDSTSYGLRASYQFGKYFAIELAHQEYGETNNNFIDEYGDRINIDTDSSSNNLGVKAIFPLSDAFSINARAGLARWDFSAETTDSSDPDYLSKVSADDQDIYYSLGAEYHFNDRFFIGIEYSILKMDWTERYVYEDYSFVEDDELKIENISLSVGMKF